ncbi:hypothetical protein GGI03_000488 [Coemansia sp. RSA 2337]|nr:hypothetical protein H4S03_003347 [Coemansia sp. S3946]KAJ2113370.1 hypothetical protein IW146_003920 [Coemansia sp. RSA 922]KAJ2469263.1 hypothetical protein GGI03_000488 [Coemansia sp. RSA 2337]
MDTHPKYHEVASVCNQHPQRARALFQAYLDLKYGQRLDVTGTPVLSGIDFPAVLVPGSHGLKPQVFVPVYADEKLDMKILSTIPLSAQLILETDVSTHLAIVEDDSTIAYYKIGSDLHNPLE